MKHRMIIMLLAVALAACSASSAPAPAPTQPPDNGAVALATNVPQAKATEPATAASTPEVAKPAATPDIEKIVKPQPDDWKRGSDGAKVTIIEWGDFQ